jgi:hypothetical protein
MAPLTSTETFTTELAPADVLARTQEWFAKYKGQVVATSENEIEVKSGSQAKMRLLGGAFIAATSLPVRTRITLTPNGGGNDSTGSGGTGTDVTVTAEDAVGFGAKTGMKSRYLVWLGEITAGLRTALT